MAELIDLVDKTGKVVKAGATRDDLAHHPDLHMQIVIVVLFRGEHVLVHARSRKKKVNPGDIDHVCGGIVSGETPIEAAMREAYEETGVKPTNLRIVTEGVNEYNRYRYLLIGEAEDEPTVQDADEVEWTDYIHVKELYYKSRSGELTFVDGFFQDIELANHVLG
jgi:8-oxo-dGTP pyrophosphatase MutT (NUDIX family)